MRRSQPTRRTLKRQNSNQSSRSLDGGLLPKNATRDKHHPKPVVVVSSNSHSTFSPNSENVGGRFLIDQNFHRHQEQMKKVKTQVDNSLPWSYQQGSSRLYSVSLNRSTGNTKTKKVSTMKKSKKKKAINSLDMNVLKSDPTLVLDEFEREKYEEFVEMLCQLCLRNSKKSTAAYMTELSRQIGKTAANDAIERYLLSDYGEVEVIETADKVSAEEMGEIREGSVQMDNEEPRESFHNGRGARVGLTEAEERAVLELMQQDEEEDFHVNEA